MVKETKVWAEAHELVLSVLGLIFASKEIF